MLANPTAGDDPRGTPSEAAVQPDIAVAGPGVPAWLIGVVIAVAAIILFATLEARRRALTAPPTRPRSADLRAGSGTPPAPLFVPPSAYEAPDISNAVAPPPPPPAPPPPPPRPQIVYVPQPAPPMPVVQPPPEPRSSNGPALIIDNTAGESTAAPAAGADSLTAVATRARASVVRNRATTVAQGSLIPAVLESALDSTRPGPVRALVQRDIRGFDGTHVLIPRGSRLYGEYRADLQLGQNRALVIWNRLVRPDGVSIALGSPAADPLGRVGIRGKVNSHFFERFGAAILQSALDIGVAQASQLGNTNPALLVALPTVARTATDGAVQRQPIPPSLTVRQGTAISVFVARDLDFTAVERKR